MCGRYALAVAPADLEQEFSLIRIEWFPPRYNIAPTQPIHVVRAEKGGRALALMRWGLIPSWAKNPADLPLFFNARSETAPEKPAFRGPFRQRRCLIPATGFYEWKKLPGGAKQPYLVAAASRRILALAGLWDEYADDKGNILDSATILTTAANGDLAPIHDRMPVVIAPGDYDRWLGLAPTARGEVEALMAPVPDGFFDAIPVSPRVNSARDDDPALQERMVQAPPAADKARPAEKKAAAPPAKTTRKPAASSKPGSGRSGGGRALDQGAETADLAEQPSAAPEQRQLKLF